MRTEPPNAAKQEGSLAASTPQTLGLRGSRSALTSTLNPKKELGCLTSKKVSDPRVDPQACLSWFAKAGRPVSTRNRKIYDD